MRFNKFEIGILVVICLSLTTLAISLFRSPKTIDNPFPLDTMHISSIIFSNTNEMIITGSLSQFNPIIRQSESINVLSHNQSTGFISKLTSTNIWRNCTIQGTAINAVTSVISDDNGGLYVVGYFEEQIFFEIDSKLREYNAQSEFSDLYILKLDKDHEITWIKTWGTNGADTPTDIELDLDGNIVISGTESYFGSNNQYETSGFLLGFSSDGTMTFSGSYPAGIYDCCTTNNGEIYLIGSFLDSGCDSEFAVIYQVDTEGNIAWEHQESYNAVTWGVGIDHTETGDLYTVCHYRPKPDSLLNTATSVANISSGYVVTKFVENFDANPIIDIKSDYLQPGNIKLCVNDGDIILAGEMIGPVYFDTIDSEYNFESKIGHLYSNKSASYWLDQDIIPWFSDIFISCYSLDGALNWVNIVNTTEVDTFSDFTLFNNDIYIVGALDANAFIYTYNHNGALSSQVLHQPNLVNIRKTTLDE